MAVPTKLKLNNGQEIPVVGLGTWRSYENDAERSVKDAIDIGYRHIDTASVYENEDEVGRAINAKIRDGIVKREDIFLVTKLANAHHDTKVVEAACRKSLSKLGLDYIDLYLMHTPMGTSLASQGDMRGSSDPADVDYMDTWREMEKLVDKGLVRGIGLSNFNAAQTQRVVQYCRIKPVVNQVECHPGINQKKLIEFSRDHEIFITAYCPLARPKLDQQWPPFLFDATAQKLSQKYGRSTAQICLRYLLQNGVIIIPKSVSKNRIAENFNIFDFELSDDDMEIMDGYNTNQRLIQFTPMKNHKFYPFNAEF